MSEGDRVVPPPPGLAVRHFRAIGQRHALVSFPLPSSRAAQPGARARMELTPVEVELLRELLRGASNREIAQLRGTSAKTVSNQVSALLAKCGAGSRTDLAARWLEMLARPGP